MAIYKSKKTTKDGRQYFFRIKYKDIFGVTHDYSSPKFKNKKDAETEEAKYRIKIQENNINTSNIKFKDIYNEFIERKKKVDKPQTIRKYEVYFGHLKALHDVKINELSLNQYKKFECYIDGLPFQACYKNKLMGVFKSLIAYSAKYYNTSDSILKFVSTFKDINVIKKEMQFFTYEEYKTFDSVINDHEWHTFFELLYFMGSRQGEAQALTWNDIDFNKRTLTINKTLTTKLKGEKYTISSPKTKSSIRTLPIPKNLLNDLKTMYNNAKKYTDYSNDWFVFGNILPLAETTIQKRKNNYCKKANVKQIRIHDFRHSCASLLINKGASIALVSKYLGHANISITLNTYTHMYQSELKNMTNILDKL